MKVFTDWRQYSPEYWDHHRGHPSASNFHRIITPRTGKYSKASEGYIDELLAEFVCYTPNFFTERGQVRDTGPVSRAVQEGTDREPESRKWYTLDTGREIEEVGGCVSDCGRFWCSPDGLIGREGVLELKNPEAKTQVGYMRAGLLPDEYRPQCHGHLIVTGLPYVDFCSYHPSTYGMIVRVEPTSYTRELKVALEQFWTAYEQAGKKLGIDVNVIREKVK